MSTLCESRNKNFTLGLTTNCGWGKVTRSKDKRFEKGAFDPAFALGSIYSIMQRHIGLNRDSVSVLSLGERVKMSGESTAASAKDQAGVANLLIDTEEAEKKRISRELHDGLGQLLTSINLHLQQCIDTADSSEAIPETLTESLQLISSMTKQAMIEMRDICCALRPAILDDLGVLAAINWQCRQIAQADGKLKVTTDYDVHEAMISEVYKTAIYRIVQEALNNTVKYAAAENFVVKLHQEGDFLQLRICDDGVGFQRDGESTCSGMGLISMRERAEALGGVFELQSSADQGVEIRVLLPFQRVALSG